MLTEPCPEIFNQTSLLKFQSTPLLRQKNFNRDHDRVWKSFTDQPHLDFHFSIAITFTTDQKQKPIRKNIIFWCEPGIIFQSHMAWKRSADKSNLDFKFSTDPMTQLENFSSRSRSRLKIISGSIELWFSNFNRILHKLISSSFDAKSSRKPCRENFNQTLIDFFHQPEPEMVGG